MKAVIMAGGMGTRLRPITGDKPKPMADMLGRPIMEHIVLRLRDSGYDEICAALKYRAGDIIAHFGDGSRFGVKMEYRIEREALGTAGSVKNCADFYGSEDFLVISADAACDFQLEKLMAEHRRQKAAATIALCRDPQPLRYGLALRDSSGRIKSFIEKPAWGRVVTDCVNTGIYVLSPGVMELVPEGKGFDFGRDLFPLLLRRGERVMGLEMQGYWCDIGTPAAYYRCCADAAEGKLKIELPESFKAPAEQTGGAVQDERSPAQRIEGIWDTEHIDRGLTELCACRDRAACMDVLSGELMDLGADYSDGIRLRGRGYELHIRPSAELSALRIAVQSEDAEFARELLSSAKDVVEKLEL